MADVPQIEAIRRYVNREEHADHDTFTMGREFAEALLVAIDGLADEVMAHQVGEGYQRGHEHGQSAAIRHAAECCRDPKCVVGTWKP